MGAHRQWSGMPCHDYTECHGWDSNPQSPDLEAGGWTKFSYRGNFYFPELKLAFELNGIFHYEPIYGPEKLASIQNNDHRKFAACAEAGISLCIIDCSRMVNFKEPKAEVFLDIICDILDKNSPISPPNRI